MSAGITSTPGHRRHLDHLVVADSAAGEQSGQTAALLGIHAAVAACVALMIYVHQQHALFVVGGEDCRQIYCGDGLADAALPNSLC